MLSDAPHSGSLTPADLIGKLDVLRIECPKLRALWPIQRRPSNRTHRCQRQADGLPDGSHHCELSAPELDRHERPMRGDVFGLREGVLLGGITARHPKRRSLDSAG
jgi:hypothetical protein